MESPTGRIPGTFESASREITGLLDRTQLAQGRPSSTLARQGQPKLVGCL